MVQLLWKTVGWFLIKLKIELPSDPAIPRWAHTARDPKKGSEQVFVHLRL